MVLELYVLHAQLAEHLLSAVCERQTAKTLENIRTFLDIVSTQAFGEFMVVMMQYTRFRSPSTCKIYHPEVIHVLHS